VVDLRTRQPVRGIAVSAGVALTDDQPRMFAGSMTATTDAAGAFTLTHVPPGKLHVYARAPTGSVYQRASAAFDVPRGVSEVAMGDVAILAARVANDTPRGELGFDLDTWDRQIRVKRIDEDGPAVASGLVIGDVITKVDGVDVTGTGRDNWEAL